MNEMKTKFLKHRQILVSNYEQAESEIKRLDEIYHETVQQVLQVILMCLATIISLVNHSNFICRPFR